MHMCPHRACSWAASRAWGLHWPWKQIPLTHSLCELQAHTGSVVFWVPGCPGYTPTRQGGTVLLKAFAVQHLPHLCQLALQKRRCCRGWVRGPSCLVCQPHLSGAAGCTGEHAGRESEVSSGSVPTMQLHRPLHPPERAAGNEQAGTEMGSCSSQGHSKLGLG